jgi:carbon storage regulator CsrA
MFNTTYRHKPGSTPGRWFPRLSQSDAGAVEGCLRCYQAELSGGRHGTQGRSAWPSIIMEVATMGVLVLTRGKLQTVVIDAGDETIEVIVAEIRGDKVKLAFSASKNVQINRPEIREKKLNSAKKDGVS